MYLRPGGLKDPVSRLQIYGMKYAKSERAHCTLPCFQAGVPSDTLSHRRLGEPGR